MHNSSRVLAILSTLTLTGCGMAVPELTDGGNAVSSQMLINSIVYNVRCEIRDSIYDLYHPAGAPGPPRTILDNWVVLVTLGLQIDERSTVSPNMSWIQPTPAVFTMGFGANAFSDALREEKISFTDSIVEIKAAGKCKDNTRPEGIHMLSSDLKLREYIFSIISLNDTKDASESQMSQALAKSGAFTHHVKFEISTSVNGSPSWKLKRFQIDQSGNTFAFNRDRQSDLVMTFSQASSLPKPGKAGAPEASTQGQALHSSAVIGSAIQSALRAAQ